MNNTIVVRIGEGVGKLIKDAPGLCYIQRFAHDLQMIQTLPKGATIDQLHNNVEVALIFTGIMDSDNVGM